MQPQDPHLDLPPVQPTGQPVPMGSPQAMPPAYNSQHNAPSVSPVTPAHNPQDDSARAFAQVQQMVVSLPEEASDTDLIEKAWVHKAKQVVDHTRNDPYTLQNEINKVKADYLKKRYNKDIKLPEQ